MLKLSRLDGVLKQAVGPSEPRKAAVHATIASLRREIEALALSEEALRGELFAAQERADAAEGDLERRLEAVRRVVRSGKISGGSIRPRVFGRALRKIRFRLALLRPNPLFDGGWYLRVNEDVRASRMDPYRHYRRHGAREGRDPSPFFDRDWYLQQNPDVAADGMDPMDHYYLCGAKEGRDPSPSFHSDCYLAMYPDVLVGSENPLLHYQRIGAREARRICAADHWATSALMPPTRHGELLNEALGSQSAKLDYLWFGVIDWEFRTQRPQHLASWMADTGHRVVYVSPHFDRSDGRGAFTVISNPRSGVFEVRLKLRPPIPTLYAGLNRYQIADAIAAIRECAEVLSLRHPVAVVEFPAWRAVALSVPGATVVLDCLDHVAGFSNVPTIVVEEEASLVSQADVAIASSRQLCETLSRTRPTTLVRNGSDTQFFAESPEARPLETSKPVIGYFGAISEWFEVDWIEHAARTRPDWDFVLIGSTDGCDTTRVGRLPNVHLVGEQPYAMLPAYLHQFDVSIIPFKVTELTNSTNPVKLYEYLSAGVPVVASPMPEIQGLGDLVYLASDRRGFVRQLALALRQDDEPRRERRRAWAKDNDWTRRGADFDAAIMRAFVKVSVVVLCHNNWAFTDACLRSVNRYSNYPDDLLEVIVVDNASTDATAQQLHELELRDSRVKVIRNSENVGFAGGNNVGIRQSTGGVVILLNNDTYVTSGWIRRLIRPLVRDDRVGLTGPLTNNIGNEQKVAIAYRSMEEMQRESTRFVDARLGQTFETDNLAFFCVAIRRQVLDEVHLLDEAYGIGYFEDDDYCRRAAEAGWRMVIVDDVFVHHHLSASFDTMGLEARRKLFEENRRIYEAKWGAWRPHKYRDAPGFGG